jgi:uncharacterized protein (TIGR02444 family)
MLYMGETRLLEDEFWEYAGAVYRRGGVSRILLDWQDHLGANVNAVLLCLWAANRGRALSVDDCAALRSAVAGWHAAAVVPLRELRRRLKADWSGLASEAERVRQAVFEAELAAERAEQAAMIRALAPWPNVGGTASCHLARQNVLTYLETSDTAALADLMTLIG